MSVPDWLQRWVSPAGFLILFGGLVWGIQLNVATLKHTSEIAANRADIETVTDAMREATMVNREMTLLIKQMQKNDAEMHEAVKLHAREAEGWKQRIIRLEERGGGWRGGRGYEQ